MISLFITEEKKKKKALFNTLKNFFNSRCCCNEMPPTTGQNLDLFLPTLHRGTQQSCFQENCVMQYARET